MPAPSGCKRMDEGWSMVECRGETMNYLLVFIGGGIGTVIRP